MTYIPALLLLTTNAGDATASDILRSVWKCYIALVQARPFMASGCSTESLTEPLYLLLTTLTTLPTKRSLPIYSTFIGVVL